MSAQLLSDWSTRNGFFIDSRICICYDEIRGIHVVSRDAPIPPGITLVRIPKDAVLSVKSCSLSKHIPFELHGLGAQLGLSFALYFEILRGDSSRWSGYLRSLPRVDLPVFWGCDTPKRPNGVLNVPDRENPLLWLHGTKVQNMLDKRDDNDRTLLDSIDHYYHEVVAPTLRRPDIQQLLEHDSELTGFQQAYSDVSSRAFLLDAYHGLAMAPVADAFNHVLENHVHIESDFYVCPGCGSLTECAHDRDEQDNVQHVQWRPRDSDLYYDMVTDREISQQEEVFNTYGAKLCNAQLLVRYGFILDPNDNDTVDFDMDEVLCSPPLSQEVKGIAHFDDAELASHVDMFIASNLVFAHNPPNTEALLCINSDGKISCQLWLLLVGFVIQNNHSAGSPTALCGRGLREAITTQLFLENLLQEVRPKSVQDLIGGKDASALRWGPVLLEVGHAIIKLCEKKKESIGLPGYTDEDLGEILDVFPQGKERLRLALFIAICERSIVDSCKFNWLDFIDNM